MFVLDTNTIIYHFNGEQTAEVFILEKLAGTEVLIVPTIVVTEFLSYTRVTEAEIQKLHSLLSYLEVAPLSFDLAEFAGILRKDYGMHLADAVIAATALSLDATLVTRNIKDFKKIKGLKLQEI